MMLLVVLSSATRLIQEYITLAHNGEMGENRFYVCATIWVAVFMDHAVFSRLYSP